MMAITNSSQGAVAKMTKGTSSASSISPTMLSCIHRNMPAVSLS